MGLRTETRPGPAPEPEKLLWCAVLLQAVKDSAYYGAMPRDLLAKQRARQWAARRLPDYLEVCDLAGADPERMADAIMFRPEAIIQQIYGKGMSRNERDKRKRALQRYG